MITVRLTLVGLVVLLAGSMKRLVAQADSQQPLAGWIICLDPGHGGTTATDQYRVGLAGEREEWVNLRVGRLLKDLLEDAGATVIMTRSSDVFIPLEDRAAFANAGKADLFLSIHHNATADTSVNFPVIYFHGNAQENMAGVQLSQVMAQSLADSLHDGRETYSAVSDYTIFPAAGASVLRNSYGIPGVLVEASFFTNPAEEQRLMDPKYNKREARAYLRGIVAYFSGPQLPILEKHTIVPPFEPMPVLQEADRMGEEARLWKEYYEAANYIYEKELINRYDEACRLFLQSIVVFPDSCLAGRSLRRYVGLLTRMGQLSKAKTAEKRLLAYYP